MQSSAALEEREGFDAKVLMALSELLDAPTLKPHIPPRTFQLYEPACFLSGSCSSPCFSDVSVRQITQGPCQNTGRCAPPASGPRAGTATWNCR